MADPYVPTRCWLAGGTMTTGSHLWLLEYKNGSILHTEMPYDFGGSNQSYISAMAFSPINKDYRYVLNGDGRFFYSSDRGTTWTASTSTGPGSHYFYGNAIVPSPGDINTIYLAGAGYSGSSVWVSHDGGETFAKMNNGLKNTLIYEMVSNEDGSLLFAASEIAPWVYIKVIDQWFDLSGTAAPQQTWWSVDYVPSLKTARFGTYGRGIWDFKIESFNGVEEILAGNGDIILNAYPNPFSDQLSVAVNEAINGKTTIRLTTITGKVVTTRVMPEGIHAGNPVTLDASGMAAGTYLLTIENSLGTRLTKMVMKGSE
jgi:hypothetical protein